jgi:hypothetical protein
VVIRGARGVFRRHGEHIPAIASGLQISKGVIAPVTECQLRRYSLSTRPSTRRFSFGVRQRAPGLPLLTDYSNALELRPLNAYVAKSVHDEDH